MKNTTEIENNSSSTDCRFSEYTIQPVNLKNEFILISKYLDAFDESKLTTI